MNMDQTTLEELKKITEALDSIGVPHGSRFFCSCKGCLYIYNNDYKKSTLRPLINGTYILRYTYMDMLPQSCPGLIKGFLLYHQVAESYTTTDEER